jgi:hypothetical protein
VHLISWGDGQNALYAYIAMVVAGITIPRLPVTPRFQSQLAEGTIVHVPQLWHVLSTQSDGTSYNVAEPYGVLDSSIFFLLAVSLAISAVVFALRGEWPTQRALLAVWLVAALPIGLVQEPNMNRINLLLMNRCDFDSAKYVIARAAEAVPTTFIEDHVFGLLSVYTKR